MRIAFSSDTRPTRISKSIKNRLEAQGLPFPYSKVREAVAAMFGYRGWNDLLSQIGKGVPSPYDDQVNAAACAERAAVFSSRLSIALDLPKGDAAEVLAAVGPMSRTGEAKPADGISAGHIRSMASLISQRYPRISPVSSGRFSGFRIEGMIVRGRMLNVDLTTSEDGDLFYGPAGDQPHQGQQTRKDHVGNFLHDNGLARPLANGESDVSPLVLSTLSRLDLEVLGMLRGAPSFSCDTYRIARTIPRGSAFRTQCLEYPMLAGEIERAARAGRAHGSRPDRTVIDADDPVDVFVELALDAGGTEWPLLDMPSHDHVTEVARTILRMLLVHDAGIAPLHVAFLSLGSDSGVPRSSEQLKAALSFIDANPRIFRDDGLAISPEGFFSELFGRFGGNWLRLASYASRSEMMAVDVADEIGTTLILAAVAEVDGLDKIPEPKGRPATRIIGRRIAFEAMHGLGYAAAGEKLARFRAMLPHLSRTSPQWADAGLAALVRSGFLPDDGRSAVDIVDSFGMGPTALFLEPGEDGAAGKLGRT
jgi:hypothetical protein